MTDTIESLREENKKLRRALRDEVVRKASYDGCEAGRCKLCRGVWFSDDEFHADGCPAAEESTQ